MFVGIKEFENLKFCFHDKKNKPQAFAADIQGIEESKYFLVSQKINHLVISNFVNKQCKN